MKHRDLGVRTLINGLSALFIVFIVFLGLQEPFRIVFALFLALIGAIAVWEYGKLIEKKKLSSSAGLLISFVVLYILATFFQIYYAQSHPFWKIVPHVVLWLGFFSCFVCSVFKDDAKIGSISAAFLGIVYVAVPLSLILKIMYFFKLDILGGAWWVAYLIVVTKASDIGGYFIGSCFGKHKLALSVSPNKTLEGALGGLAISILASLLFCVFWAKGGRSFPYFTYLSSLWLGALIGILGQLGDLAESLLKRDAGVKDSNTLPGVGGVLDMIDSLLFTAPVLYLFLTTVVKGI